MPAVTAPTIVRFDALPTLAGRDLGWTMWRRIDQERIDRFAEATDDFQWIHVDAERARTGPYGRTIAHGFLTLSLVAPLWAELLRVEGAAASVNYGMDRVRFISPVPVDARVRMNATVVAVDEVRGGWRLTVDHTMDVEQNERPAMVSRNLYQLTR